MKTVWLVTIFSVGCFAMSTISGTPEIKSQEGFRFRLEIRDHPELARFDLILRSLDDRPFCIEFQQWPNELGQVDTGSQRAHLRSGKHVYAARDENFGYCPACVIKLPPKSTLRGFIAYKEFGKPSTIAALPSRRLDFTVTPIACTTQDTEMRQSAVTH